MADETKFTQADIDAAVAKATGDVQGLKDKIDELIGDNKKLKADLRKTQDIKPEEMAALEHEVEELRGKLAVADKTVKEATKARETAEASLKGEQTVTHKLLVENALRSELAAHGVTNPVHQKAAMALLSPSVKVEANGEDRVAKAGDKALADYVKEWAGGDEGKHFVSADGNSGGGASGGSHKAQTGKTMPRTEFDQLPPKERAARMAEGYTLTDEAA